LDKVWEVVQQDIVDLRIQIERIKNEIDRQWEVMKKQGP
jgi:hypothetical protein